MSGALERLGHQLTTAADEVPAEQLAAAKQRVDELIIVFDEATHPSANPDVVAALAQLRHASETLGRALGRAHRIVGALAILADQWGLTPIRRTLPPVPPPTPAASGTGPSRSGSGWVQAPPHIVEIGHLLPVRRSRVAPTTGRFDGKEIPSGENMSSVEDLLPYPHGGWPRTLTNHVESHVAALMREKTIQHGELVINNIVCGNRDFDREKSMTCERLLSGILPKDSTLTIWATPDGGKTWWTKTYLGTGTAIMPKGTDGSS